MQNQSNIKTALEKANKYDDVMTVIRNIARYLTPSTYPKHPAKPFVDKNGETHWHVAGTPVKEEAIEIINIIEGNVPEDTENLFQNLLAYVSNRSDTKLLNYAVSISYRQNPNEDMDNIRSWEILESIIHHLRLRHAYPHEGHVFGVPEGWCRKYPGKCVKDDVTGQLNGQ